MSSEPLTQNQNSESEPETQPEPEAQPQPNPQPEAQSQPNPQPESQPEPTKNADPETGSSGSQQSLPQRLLTWTREDLFDLNPDYAKSLRGVLNILQIVFSMFVMSLVGSACHTSNSGFDCKTSGTFTFVLACSAFIQSIIFCACCLLSKEGDKRIHATSYEMVYYVTYASFFFIAGLAITVSVSSKDNEGKYQVNVGGGVFAIFTAISYTCSAVWFFIYHKKYTKKMDDEND